MCHAVCNQAIVDAMAGPARPTAVVLFIHNGSPEHAHLKVLQDAGLRVSVTHAADRRPWPVDVVYGLPDGLRRLRLHRRTPESRTPMPGLRPLRLAERGGLDGREFKQGAHGSAGSHFFGPLETIRCTGSVMSTFRPA